MKKRNIAIAGVAVIIIAGITTSPVASATPKAPSTNAAAVAAYWTPARMAAAIPRDIVVDEHGKSFLADAKGTLRPHGLNKVLPVASKGKPGGTGSLSNVIWTKGGTVQHAAGRLYFVMDNTGWVCSGTTVVDENTSTSVILTAAHCVYDDVLKAFATQVLFIPDLASSGTRTYATCADGSMYAHGCWLPDFGVVYQGWTQHEWPDNIPYDYGFWVVKNTGGHVDSSGSADEPLDELGAVGVEVDQVTGNPVTDALGYSYKYDPQLMYCEQPLGRITGTYDGDPYTNFWLSACKLSGGASGGPWMAATASGAGPVVSVNSWGYNGRPGMAGPNLQDAIPQCVYQRAAAEDAANVIVAGCST